MKRAVVFLLVVLTANVVFAEDPVYFADPNLKAAVEEKLGISGPTPSDMLALISLDARSSGISDLTGIEYATNLTYLVLNYNQITDISALSGLTSVTDLHLYNNNISDITALSGLTSLRALTLNQNNISDISSLSGLTSLESLGIHKNNVSDISSLSGLINLSQLILYNNNISDLSSLSALTNLTRLYVHDNNISNIFALSGLTNLRYLVLRNNNISDITTLSGFSSLLTLYIGNNNISDITALSGLTSLRALSIYKNNISDISSLSGLTSLIELSLYNNDISDISPLSELTNLTHVYLFTNPLDPPAYCIYLPLIEDNNPGLTYLIYEPNPNPRTGDCDGDCLVDLFDFALIGSYWQEVACGGCGGADQTDDSNVDTNDLKVLTDNWLEVAYIKFYEEVLDDDPNWTTEGEWEFGQPTGGGGFPHGYPDPNSGYTGTNVYGLNLNGDYDKTIGGPYYLTTSPIDCSYFENITLKFARWLNIDKSANVGSFIEVSNDGITWVKVWQHSGNAITDNSWQVYEYDISEIADYQSTVYIRWSYEIWTKGAKPYSGWNIDDIELWGNP